MAAAATINDFSEVSSGARFHRVDLHIHSYGGSSDVSDTTMTPEAIVAKAVEKGIGLIALADHNSIANVVALLTAAEATDKAVTAIPGVEITTSSGHVLVYCAPDQVDALGGFLTKLDFLQDEQGERYTRLAIDEVAARAREFGGIAIPAHCGRENTGFLTKAPHRECQAVFESPAILGVEIDGNDHVDWFTSRDSSDGHQLRAGYLAMRQAALAETPAATRLARLLFSDAHRLDSIGTARDGSEKLTRVKMEEPSFGAFVAALLDPDARVVLEQPLPEIYPRVVGIRYVGGFLDGQEIAFGPNLTALIGGRGAGKSTAMEALRCACLGDSSAIEGSDAWPQTVQIEYLDSFGGRHFVQRDAGTGHTFEVMDDGTSVPFEIPLEGYEQDHIAEIIRSTDKDSRLLLEFLDRFVQSPNGAELLDDLKRQLAENAEELLPVYDAPTALTKAKQDLDTAKGRIRLAEQTKAKEALNYRRLLLSERQLRQAILDAVAEVESQVAGVRQGFALADLAGTVGVADLNALPASSILLASGEGDSIEQVLAELGASVASWKANGVAHRQPIRDRLDALIKEWEDRDRRIEAKIRVIIDQLRAQGITPDLAHINKLAAAEAAAQQQVTKQSTRVAERNRLLTARAALLKRYRAAQDRRTFDRNDFGRRVAQQFRDAGVEFSVGMKFRDGRLVGAFESWLREGIGNRFMRGERVTEFCQGIHPIDLADDLGRGRTARLVQLADSRGNAFLTAAEAREFVSHLAAKPERLFDLELILREDEPDISLTQTQEGNTRSYPFRHLSFGQRASILLGVLLFSDEMHPLVIDQPEDHLDSAFIYDAVVQTLRRVKERRQVIVATHNANIAILGDAELIVPLQSWAGRGRIRDRGSVDSDTTRRRACKILEGGEDAYRRRGEMYGIAPAK
jgi:hypothetical protein